MKQPSTDWRDALSSLMPSMPEGAEPEVQAPGHPAPGPTPRKLRIDMERKGRGGKTATIVSGFDLPDGEIEEIASKIKKKLGAGGSARGGEILIQGDRREEVRACLKEMGLMK